MEQLIANGTAAIPVEAWQYGVLGVVCCLFLWAIVKLWRVGRTDGKNYAEREKAWALERASLHTQLEKEKKENAEGYAMQMEELRDQFLAREDALRKEFADRMERVANEANMAANKQNEVLNKIYERFVGPRRGRTG